MGETGLTYVTASADEGKYLSFYEEAINAVGNSGFIRAVTGNARPLYLLGDSLMGNATLSTTIQSALDSAFGANGFHLVNFSVSGQNYNHSPQNFGVMSTQSVDINIEPGWDLVVSFDYANQFSGIQGIDSGATGLTAIYAFVSSRVSAGAINVLCTSPYPTGIYYGSFNGTNAYTASQDIATNYLSNGAVALIDFRDAALSASIIANDGVHWTSGVYSTVADKFVNGLTAASLASGCGGIYVPTSGGTHLKTYSTSYYYDPAQRLPWPKAASTISVTSANGWAAKTVSAIQGIHWFNTPADGWQTLYYSNSWQTHPLSDGHYTLNP